MNVFLPYPDYHKSAHVLDNKRLVKQLLETKQILATIKNGGAWSHHPIVGAFKRYPDSLVRYGRAVAQELIHRNYKHAIIDEINQYYQDSPDNPPWLGDCDFHASHRSNLLRKGRIDAVCETIRRHFKMRSINKWFKELQWPQKNNLTVFHVLQLEEFARLHNLDLLPNHYRQFGWEEKEDLLYVWP